MPVRADSPIKRPVGRPRQVSLQQILEAVSVIGLENLTLQAVADAIEVTPGALYRHVESKEDLISKFVGYITERFPISPHDGETWLDWAPRFADALLHMYQAVPGLADYTIRRTHTSDSVLIRHEVSILAARRSGFDELGALYATRAVVEFVAGWVAREQRRKQVEREQGIHPDEEFRRHVLTVTPERYPQLAASLDAATGLPSYHRFRFTLNALISGLVHSLAGVDGGSRRNARR